MIVRIYRLKWSIVRENSQDLHRVFQICAAFCKSAGHFLRFLPQKKPGLRIDRSDRLPCWESQAAETYPDLTSLPQ
jgi:hypothetical protein